MASPRLFGRDSSKQQGVEPGTIEIETKPRRRKTGAPANSAVMRNLVDDLLNRGIPVKPEPKA